MQNSLSNLFSKMMLNHKNPPNSINYNFFKIYVRINDDHPFTLYSPTAGQ